MADFSEEEEGEEEEEEEEEFAPPPPPPSLRPPTAPFPHGTVFFVPPQLQATVTVSGHLWQGPA